MSWDQAVERRAHPRVPASGRVVFHSPVHQQQGRLRVLSAVELEVRCQLGIDLIALAAHPVEFELLLDDGHSGWLRFCGRITHIRPVTRSVVIAIDLLPPALVTAIDAQQEPRAADAITPDRDPLERVRALLRRLTPRT